MKKIFSFLKLNGWEFFREKTAGSPVNQLNDKIRKVLAVLQPFYCFFDHYFVPVFVKYKVGDKSMSAAKYLLPPETVRGMKKLDRSAFTVCIQIPVLVVSAEKVGCVLKLVKHFLLKMNNFKPLQETENAQIKHIYLNPDSVRCFDDLKECKLALIKEGINESDLFWNKMDIGYKNWNSDVILKSILPVNQNISSYSIIGHILHLNLKDHLVEYKYVIGQVLLDKIHNIRTVVNKTNTINSKYRNFSMEILCGEDDMDVCVKENGCVYKFDFSKVYWNPRLSTEHLKVVKKLKKGDIVFDIFAGVGPFSIPAAKKRCTVLANDLNPDCFNCLHSNAKLNNVAQYMEFFNMDGRNFIYQVMKPHLLKIWEKKTSQNVHIIMNLPAIAVEFLDAFIGLGKDAKEISEKLPVVHCYCFVVGDGDYKELAVSSIEKHLNSRLGCNLEEASYVRNVAPSKEMVRVSFRIPKQVLLENSNHEDEPPAKRTCDGLD